MLNTDYKDMLSLLQKHRVDFMLIGAYALACHGIPRSTGDIDLLIRCDRENAARTDRAIIEFGTLAGTISAEYLAVYGNIFQIGVAPCRIDLITQIDGLTFDEAHTVKVAIDGLEVPVITREDLIRNKRASGRMRDLADVEALELGGS